MENKPNAEPTMEEILAAIRRNILQEPEKPLSAAAPVAPISVPPFAPSAAPAAPMPTIPPKADPAPLSAPSVSQAPVEPEEEPLDLTDMVAADGQIVSLKGGAPAIASHPAPSVIMPGQASMVAPDLVAHHVATAVVASISQLAILKPQPAPLPQPIGDGLSVETLVRQSVEPMLKDWLDRHLPIIVEQAVRREVERIARKVELG